jgi:ribosome biogenesis GTPase / thiamine phosphate phosphatase
LSNKIKDLSTNPEQKDLRGTLIAHHGVAVRVHWDTGKADMTRVLRKSGFLVGDRVYWENNKLKREERTTELHRATTAGQTLSVAANIDCVGIVVAPEPDTSTSFIDQVVVTSRAAQIKSFLVLNKKDLNSFSKFEHQLRQEYQSALDIFSVSAKTGDGLNTLKNAVAQYGRGLWVGASGVGKSSLVNSLLQDSTLAVGNLSEVTGFGKHTTTTATLHRLKQGGEIVDTPGVREFIPVQMASADIAQFFPGFEQILQSDCRFHNCMHHKEPDCVIKDALANKTLSQERYKVYISLLEQTEKRNKPDW